MAYTRGKIITTFCEHRRIEAEILGMLDLADDAEVEGRAAEIAGAGHLVVPVILRNLGTSNSRLLGILGQIAANLNSDELCWALRRVAMDCRCSDQERMSAILLLDRYLGEDLNEEFFEGLENPQEIALQSLSEMLDESKYSRLVLIDYLQTLDEQPVDVVLSVLDALGRSRSEQMVEPLRLLAQDHRLTVAKEALRCLGMIRSPISAGALQTLVNGLVGPGRRCAERSLRKLVLCGIDVVPLPKAKSDWRCLVSPIDGEGNQSVWFIQTSREQAFCNFLHVLVNDKIGMVDALADDRALYQHFPVVRKKGALHIWALSDSPMDAIMMETDFDYGRRLVREALAVHMTASDKPVPLAYRLFSDLLWGYDEADVELACKLPVVAPDKARELLPYTGELVRHPAFSVWLTQDTSVYHQAVRVLCRWRGGWDHPEEWYRRVSAVCFDERCRTSYARQLRRMSEWLWLLGDGSASRLALAASMTMQDMDIGSHPFLVALLEAMVRRARGEVEEELVANGSVSFPDLRLSALINSV